MVTDTDAYRIAKIYFPILNLILLRMFLKWPSGNILWLLSSVWDVFLQLLKDLIAGLCTVK